MTYLLSIFATALGILMGANDVGNVLGPIAASGAFKINRLLIFSSITTFAGALFGGRSGILLNASLGKYSDFEIIAIYAASVIVISFFFFKNYQ